MGPLGHKKLDMTEQLSTAHNTIQKLFIGVFLKLEAMTKLSSLSTTPWVGMDGGEWWPPPGAGSLSGPQHPRQAPFIHFDTSSFPLGICFVVPGLIQQERTRVIENAQLMLKQNKTMYLTVTLYYL